MPFSAGIVPEEEFTPASLFQPSSHTATITAATVTSIKATLSSCSSTALPTVITSQNGDTADAATSTSHKTNISASSSTSNMKNISPKPEKIRHQGNEKQNLRSTLPRIKIWKKSEIEVSFSNNDQTNNQ
jgi:hypothetical protein